jgi:hypothetical protein
LEKEEIQSAPALVADMSLCVLCNSETGHWKRKACSDCHSTRMKTYQKEYREKNKEICFIRSQISASKKRDHYLAKRREYYRKKHGIPLDDPFVKRKAGEGNIDCQGYKTITKRGHPNQMDSKGRIREHIFVMSGHLGRPLNTKIESVHQKNGIRTDNRIENLELWHRGQPPGQRLEDKIKWAIEFLKEYGYTVDK